MLARIAHELFWLGRNLARAEHTARMLDGVFQASLQGRPDDPAGVTLDWRSLLGDHGRAARRRPRRAATRSCARSRSTPTTRPRSWPASGARARARAPCATSSRPRCGRRSTPPTCSLRGSGDLSARLRSRPVLGLRLRQGALRAVLGPDVAHDAARRGVGLPRRRRAHRVGRHGPADAARRAAAGRPGADEHGRARPGAGAAAGRRRLPGLPPRGARAAERAARSRASCSSSAPTPTRSRRRSTPSHNALVARRRQPAQLRAGAAPAAPERRPRVPRPRAGRRRRPARAPARRSRRSSSAVDRDIAERYFAGARRRPWSRHELRASATSPSTATTAPVTDNLNALRVRPATTSTQRVDDFHVRVDPEARLQRHLDYFGTEVIEFGVAQPARPPLDRRARARRHRRAAASRPTRRWEALGGRLLPRRPAASSCSSGRQPSPRTARSTSSSRPRAPTSPLATLRLLCELVPDRFEYRQGATYVGSTIQDLLDAGAGVCQDFVHLGLVLLRRHGIAARYVSGYLWAAPQDGGSDSRRGRHPRLARGAAAGRRPARRAGLGRRRPDQPPAGGRDPREDRPRPRTTPTCRRSRASTAGPGAAALDAAVTMTRLDPQASARA